MASTNSNQFFEEEEGLARRQGVAPAIGARLSKSKSAVQAAKKASGQSGSKPPSFALVVAIAIVALLLGMGIGYFIAMATVGSVSTASYTVDATSQALSTDDKGESLPSGHPDISSMMNADGSVNEEALEAYKASKAAEDSEL